MRNRYSEVDLPRLIEHDDDDTDVVNDFLLLSPHLRCLLYELISGEIEIMLILPYDTDGLLIREKLPNSISRPNREDVIRLDLMRDDLGHTDDTDGLRYLIADRTRHSQTWHIDFS